MEFRWGRIERLLLIVGVIGSIISIFFAVTVDFGWISRTSSAGHNQHEVGANYSRTLFGLQQTTDVGAGGVLRAPYLAPAGALRPL